MEAEEKVIETVLNFANAMEAAAVDVKHRIAELVGVKEAVVVQEETFNILKYEAQKGTRLGEFEVASKANNLSDKWTHAYGVLKQNNATISNRYHGLDYTYSYWLYKEDQIYRQKLKGSEAKTASATALPNLFSKELADLVIFEDAVDSWKIQPRGYLGSETFAKIAAIVKEHGGEYISAGKESHFRLPKNTDQIEKSSTK